MHLSGDGGAHVTRLCGRGRRVRRFGDMGDADIKKSDLPVAPARLVSQVLQRVSDGALPPAVHNTPAHAQARSAITITVPVQRPLLLPGLCSVPRSGCACGFTMTMLLPRRMPYRERRRRASADERLTILTVATCAWRDSGQKNSQTTADFSEERCFWNSNSS